MIVATLRLYGEAARDATAAFARSAWALAWLLVASALLVVLVLSGVLGKAGMLGGFIYGIARAAAAGTYLASVQDALGMRKSMSLDAVRGNLGAYTWDIVNAMFPIWVASFLVDLTGVGLLSVALSAGVFLFLNPVPELIGRSRSGGVDLLREAWAFMGRAGPEWLAAQLVAVLAVWALVPSGHGWMGVTVACADVFGPQMGFMGAASLGWSGSGAAVAGLDATSLARALGLVAVVHLVMLFRGALFQRLDGSSRRGRAWAERVRG